MRREAGVRRVSVFLQGLSMVSMAGALTLSPLDTAPVPGLHPPVGPLASSSGLSLGPSSTFLLRATPWPSYGLLRAQRKLHRALGTHGWSC